MLIVLAADGTGFAQSFIDQKKIAPYFFRFGIRNESVDKSSANL